MNIKKKALGRGLSALLDNSSQDISAEYEGKHHNVAGNIPQIEIDLIEANPYQPRTRFDENSLSELAESIKEHGVIQPITVTKLEEGKYQLISGERRLRASMIAGLKSIPAYIKLTEKDNFLEIAIVENIQRENLNPIDLALSFQRLIEEFSLKQEELSKKLSKNRTTITNYIRLLKLPAEIQIAIREEIITMGHARALINIEDEKKQKSIFNEIVKLGLSVRNVEELVRNVDKQKITEKKVKFKIVDEYIEIKDSLTKRLKTKVEIKVNNKGKGSIVITFKSKEEFEKVVKVINK